MATWTTTPSLASNSPAMLPADRTLEPACGWFVLGTWLFLTVVALGFVTLYGNRTPRWEDWIFVPFVTGAQRVDLSWLWEDIQGHRVPIEKLVLCACYSLFGFNSKPILYLNVLLFSALSLGLLWAIHKARGRWSYTDAFLPIVLLNLGQAEAFSWAQTFAYLSATCLETFLLIIIVTHRGALNRTSLVLAGASLMFLPLTFGGGVVFAAMMVPWMIYQGWVVQGSIGPSSRHVRPIALASALVTVTIIGLYFVGYRPLNDAPGEQYVQAGLVVYAQTALKYLALGFGGAAYRPFWQFPSLLIAVILLATLLCLIQALARSRLTGDPRAVGLASYMVSCMAVAWVVGMGRYAWGNTIFDSRYAAASVVALLGSYFVWELHGPPFFVPLGRMLFFTAAAGFLAANFQLGYLHGRTLRDAERAFLRDLRAAEPIPRLVAHHSWVTYWYHGKLERYLRQLRDAGIPPYNRLPPDPSFRVRTLRPQPTVVVEIDWNGKGGRILGPDAYVRFDMDRPEFISGLRFRFSLVDPGGMMPAVRVRLQSDTKPELQHYNCRYESTTGEEAEIIIYVDDRISRVLIFPNNRVSSFRMSNIELLLPETDPNGSITKGPERTG
ncbi:MAG TPA: hypothetical protein VKF17_12925 [Isosphaeraceae bacterium]|nr:hypothetical protein [Isosphaeraceae bacterium]